MGIANTHSQTNDVNISEVNPGEIAAAVIASVAFCSFLYYIFSNLSKWFPQKSDKQVEEKPPTVNQATPTKDPTSIKILNNKRTTP